MRLLLFGFLLCLSIAGSPLLAAAKTQVELLLGNLQSRPGELIPVALKIQPPKDWHTYWRNPGDAGEATKIEWELPAGWEAGPLEWPVPEKHVVSDITTYILHGDATLLTSIRVPPSAALGDVTLKARVSWQECQEMCIKGKKDLELTVRLADSTVVGPHGAVFDEARGRLPQPASNTTVQVRLEAGAAAEERQLILEWTDPAASQSFDFFPYADQGIEVGGASEWSKSSGVPLVGILRKKLTLIDALVPASIRGLLVIAGGKAHELALTVPSSSGPAKSQSSALIGAPGSTTDTTSDQGSQSLGLMLVFSFIGGLILNFMPCVLPVIALKVLSFVNQSQESPRRVRAMGLAYGFGVLASFLILSLLAIGAQRAGGLASWGMALQNQMFRVVLTIVVALVALNLFGVFEVTLHGGVMGAASELTSKEGLGGAFFNGVLATVLATPCTAPFLGAALAFAFTQPAAITILMFLVAGAGLAFPFVILCWDPRLLRWLPRPGAWMLHFKVAMGFPMLATAVWLFWFTAPRYGKSGVLWLGLFLVILSMSAWVYGEFVQKGRKARGLSAAIAGAVLLCGYMGILEGQLNWRVPPPKLSANSLKEGPDGIDWQPWSPEAVQRARDAGHAVLVDFTADDCLNCQVNKKTSLEIPQTRAKLRELNIQAFLGDFTDEDPLIAAELQRYKRAGVPLVLVFPKNKTAPPIVLPVILTPKLVLDALVEASKG